MGPASSVVWVWSVVTLGLMEIHVSMLLRNFQSVGVVRMTVRAQVVVRIKAVVSCELVMEGSVVPMMAFVVCAIIIMGSKVASMILMIKAMVSIIVVVRPMTHLMIIVWVKIMVTLLVVSPVVIPTVRALVVRMVMRHIVVLVSGPMVLGVRAVVVGWLSSHRCHMRVLVVFIHLLVIWFHPQN